MSSKKSKHSKTQFLDLEMLCWPNKVLPVGQTQHIIQIGIVEIDNETLNITKRHSYYVRPNNPKFEVSEYCTKLTSITRDIIIQKGRPFPEVLRSIEKEFHPSTKISYAWGQDNDVLRSHCEQYSVENPWEKTSIWDFGVFFRSAYNIRQKLSLSKAIQLANLEFPGQAHDAVIDAEAVALLHINMMKKIRNTN